MARILVVGGGLGGLAAAALLAGRGHDVELRERAKDLGGRARSHGRGGAGGATGGGAAWNQGPHALYLGGPAEEVLRGLGCFPAGAPPPTRGARLRFDGRSVAASPAAILFGRAWRGHRFAVVRAVTALGRAAPASWHGRPFSSWRDETTRDPVARRFLDALKRVATYAQEPDLDAGVCLSMMRRALKPGVVYVDGGWSSMVEALAGAAREAGARVRTGAPVERVERVERPQRPHGGSGWRVDGEVFDHVVLAVPPGVATRLLGDDAPEPVRRSASLPSLEAHCRTLVFPTRRGPGFVGDLDGRGYYAVHSRSAELGQGDGDVVQAAWYLGDGRDAADPATLLDAFLDVARPGWRDEHPRVETLPRMAVLHGVPPGGDVRSRPRADQGDGLWVVGDWVGGSWLVDAVFESACAVARGVPAVGRPELPILAEVARA